MVALSELRSAQPHAVGVLETAIVSDRMHHAYLVAGPEEADSVGLVDAAAQALLCPAREEADACGSCPSCRKQTKGNHPDLHRISPDEKGNISIDQVRALSARLALRAAESATKVAIIENADAMKGPAQNALLKTLEEPPGATCIFLTTARPRAMLPTVRSRCQTLRLSPKPRQGAWRALVEGGIEENLARALAALVGPDLHRAQALIDKGADSVAAGIGTALSGNATLVDILQAANELGANRDHTDLALALLEVQIRDRLALARGADPELLFTEIEGVEIAPPQLSNAARRLAELRRSRPLNPNRTLALEGVLLALTGHLHPSAVEDRP